MGATGSLRSVAIEGIPFNATGDANVALNDRFEKESIPHSGGNMIKFTLCYFNVCFSSNRSSYENKDEIV